MKHPLLALALLLPLQAVALTFSGTFSGVVVDAQWTPLNPNTPYTPEDFIGARLTGAFDVDIPDAWLATKPVDTYIPLDAGHASFSASVGDLNVSYAAELLLPESTGNRLSFWTSYRPRFEGGILEFLSDRGALANGNTYRVDGTTVSGIDLGFADQHASLAFNVDITSFRFDPVAAPVPEPPLALLVGVGALGLILHHRRWLRTASRRVPICTPTVSSITLP